MTLLAATARKVLWLVLTWSVSVPALADFAYGPGSGYELRGYARVLGLPPGHATPRISYNADADLLSISGPANFEWLRPLCGTFLCQGQVGQGFQALAMNVDASGHSSGGVYSVIGSIPGLSLDAPRLLVAGAISDIVIETVLGGQTPGSDGRYPAAMFMYVHMDTLYGDPALGPWGSEMKFGGFVFGQFAQPVTAESLFAASWQIGGPSDYWDLFARSPVPEPATSWLAALGFLAIGFGTRSRRRRFA